MSTQFEIKPGADVSFEGRRHVVQQILGVDRVLLKDPEADKVKSVAASAVQPVNDGSEGDQADPVRDLETYSDEDWRIAQDRMATIRPLLQDSWRSLEQVRKAAKQAGVNPATIYRWIEKYEVTGRVSSLVPMQRGPKPGNTKLPEEAEEIVEATIDELYLDKQRRKVQPVCREVVRRCRNAGVKPPHPNTVRNRITAITERRKMERRVGGRAAREKYEPIKNEFPDGRWPLDVVEIDHTPVDVALVDDVDRLPIGRPSLTLVMDVFSRVVPGFYVSLDAPSSLSVGLSLSHAVLPKERWLVERGLGGEWPVWGLPGSVHVDNAKEFRGRMLRRACEEYGMDLVWRPPGRPNFGGHVERLLGTFNAEVHNLPGTTFSNIEERLDYDSEGRAVMTLSEFESWLTTYITQVYHTRIHSELGVPPINKWEEGVLGTDTRPGRGLPARVRDEDRLRIDFLPYEERTVQRYGISLDGIAYYGDVLRRWVHAKDPENKDRKRKFLVRRDPRNIASVYFFDPDLERYYEIPYRNTSHPAISLWELREIQRRMREEGRTLSDEEAIFEAYERMKEIEGEATRETARTRRKAQRRRLHKKADKPAAPAPGEAEPVPSPQDDDWGDVQPYDDVEI